MWRLCLQTNQSVMFVPCSGPHQRPDARDHGSHPGQPWGAAEVDALSALWRVAAAEHRGAPQHAQLASVSAGSPNCHAIKFNDLVYYKKMQIMFRAKLRSLPALYKSFFDTADTTTTKKKKKILLLLLLLVACAGGTSNLILCSGNYEAHFCWYLSSYCGVCPYFYYLFPSAGYEHVQQRSGVGAVGASYEPVWLACRGCWRG